MYELDQVEIAPEAKNHKLPLFTVYEIYTKWIFFNKTMWRLTRQDEFPHNSPPQRWGFVGNTIARVFWGGYYAVSYWPKSNKSYSQVSMIFFVEISLR